MRLLLFALICCVVLNSSVQTFNAEVKRNHDTAQQLPYLYWPHGIETAPALKQAGIEQIQVPPDKADAWRAAGFAAVPIGAREFERREKLLVPGIRGRANVASPTSRPWIDANGWRFMRNPAGKFYYELPPGKAALAAAEAFAYRADAMLKIDPADLEGVGKMLAFQRSISPGGLPVDLPVIADIAVIDDGSPATGEVMNLLTRRNLLFKIIAEPSSQFPINIKLGTKEYPVTDAVDPSAFAQKIRRQLGDDKRTLRVYGTEVVICRLTASDSRARLQLLNYSGREVDSSRVRLRGTYRRGEIRAFGYGNTALEDHLIADGATEFTIPKLGIYAMVELQTGK